MTTTGSMLIDGEWVPASNGATYAVPNPATEETVGHAPDATVGRHAARHRRGAARVRRGTVAALVARGSRARAAAHRRRDGAPQGGDAPAARRRGRRHVASRMPCRSTRRSSISGTAPSWRAPSTFEESLPARASQGPLGTADELRRRLPPAGRRLRPDPDLELPALRHRAEARARRWRRAARWCSSRRPGAR